MKEGSGGGEVKEGEVKEGEVKEGEVKEGFAFECSCMAMQCCNTGCVRVCVCVCVCVFSVEAAILRIIKGLNTPEFLVQLAKLCVADPKVVGPACHVICVGVM